MNEAKHAAPAAAMSLRLDWCSHEAALYAVKHWHYSRALPAGKLVRVGVWEAGRFIGCVIFSRGANGHIGQPYGLTQLECCELTRVALDAHTTPTSRIVSIAIRMLRQLCPGMQMIVSYADSNHGHHGGIYQAGGWFYTGECASEIGVRLNGTIRHRRSVNARHGTSDMQWLRQNIDAEAEVIKGSPKYKYVFPLTKPMQAIAAGMAQPYPKRVKQATDGDLSSCGGAAPTHTLQEPI